MCNWMYSGSMGWPMMYGGIMMLITWGLVTQAVNYLFRNFLPTHRTRAPGVLQERYAKGEIDIEEYRERQRHNGLDEW